MLLRQLLAVTREVQWQAWLLYMLRAVEYTARWTTAKIAAIRVLIEETTGYIQQLCEIGVLKEVRVGREKLFVHPKLVRLMTEDSNAISPYRAA
jgi:hypothetical protein